MRSAQRERAFEKECFAFLQSNGAFYLYDEDCYWKGKQAYIRLRRKVFYDSDYIEKYI